MSYPWWWPVASAHPRPQLLDASLRCQASTCCPSKLPAIGETYYTSALGLQVRLDEPEPLVNAARDLRKQVGRVQVAQLVGRLDGLSRRLTEGRQRRGQRLDVTAAVRRLRRVFWQRAAFRHHPGRALGHAAELHR